MITLVSAVFLASLLGSLHCVGMCGAFLAVVVGDAPKATTQAGYHAGRLLTYVVLGAIAGAVGQGMNIAGGMAGMQTASVTISAIAVVLMGTITWLRLRGIRVPTPARPNFVSSIANTGYRTAMKRPPVQRAMLVGLLTTLLPCGWLWTFLITAAGTANPAKAALVMAVFWTGTLPAMLSLGVGLRGLLGAAQRRVPTLTCAAMIAVGLFTVLGRAQLNPLAWDKPAQAVPTIHTKAPCCEESDAHAD
ncbi:MAG: sulfite exporter TauE/SafE family protein [Tepidisphaeraceae bacterium]